MKVFLHNQDMHIAQKVIWRKILEEYDGNHDSTYYVKQCDEVFPHVCIFNKWWSVYVTNTSYKKCNPHQGIIITQSSNENAHK